MPKSNPMKLVGRPYDNAEDMIRDLSGEAGVQRQRAYAAKRAIKDRLELARCLQDLTMKEMATKLKWSMKRLISFEESMDSDLTLGDIGEYATALGMKFTYTLENL